MKFGANLGFIVPITWFSGDKYLTFREHLLKNCNLTHLIQLPYGIFEAYIGTAIVILQNNRNKISTETYQFDIRAQKGKFNIELFQKFDKSVWLKYGKIFLDNSILIIGDKVWFSDKNINLGKICKIRRGTLPPKEHELSTEQTGEFNLRWLNGQVFRYGIKADLTQELFVNYDNLRENKPLEFFQCEKLLARQLISRQFRMSLTYTNDVFAFKKNLYAIYENNTKFDLKYILAILNSKLFSFCQVNFNTSLQRDDFPAFSLKDFKNFPILNLQLSEQQPFIKKSNKMLKLQKQFYGRTRHFICIIETTYQPKKISKKLQNFHTLPSFHNVLQELEKHNVMLSKEDEHTLHGAFDEIQTLNADITRTDAEIDRMVYALYGLTAEEIAVVEGKESCEL